MSPEKKEDKKPEAAGKPEGDKKKAKQPKAPRAKGEVAHDFRMASFFGTIVRVVESWSKGRKLSITVDTEDHRRAAQGLERFMSSDEILFRLVPRQPLIGDKDPEDFSLKVPRFCVEMVMRLEKKATEGFSGWETFQIKELARCAGEKGDELFGAAANDKIDAAKVRKLAVDVANYAFFVWSLAEIAGKGKPAEV